MKAIVIFNAAAGQNAANVVADARHREVASALVGEGIEADLRPVEGAKLAAAAKAAIDERPDAIVAVGGDGTVSAVASALAGSDVAMGVIPLGTLNHFAKDLRLPLELPDAARVIAAGNVARVDVALVNDRLFVNNSSIGLYPQVVRKRDRIREQLGRGKWYAMLTAILAVFRLFPTVRLRMTANGETFLRTTPFVFVGNNQYRLDLFSLGQRQRLDGGDLCLYFSNRTGRTGLVRLILRTLFNRLSQDKDFNAVCTREVWIDAPRKSLSVALDGEVFKMHPPLHYRIWPRSLKVLLPPPPNPAIELATGD